MPGLSYPFLFTQSHFSQYRGNKDLCKFKYTGGISHVCPPRLSFPITVNSKYLLLSLGLYRPNTEVPVLGCNLKEVRMKASFAPCSTRPPCRRSGRQSGEVIRSYTVDEKERHNLGTGCNDMKIYRTLA